jgi:hypothetical protein
MDSTVTALKSAAVLCLVLACGACSRQRFFAQPHGLLTIPAPTAVAPAATPADTHTPPVEPTKGKPIRPLGRLAQPLAERHPRFRAYGQAVRADHRNYYSWPFARHLLLGIAAGSVLANTSLDQDFQDWYQDDVKSSGTYKFARAWEAFGEGEIIVPAVVGLGLLGKMCEDTPEGSLVGQFGCRAGRSWLVGAPPMVFMQYTLGASRPGESPRYQSRWKPFDDGNSIAGHGFIAAVPFITAAQMTDRPLLKGGLYFCSTVGCWSRIDTDSHYLSQAWLGWWMAYLACCAVNKTNEDYQGLTFMPITTPEMVGAGAVYEW